MSELNDLISRSALLSTIRPDDDQDTMAAVLLSDVKKILRNAISNAPAVDAVEVGSCEGCYWKKIGRQPRCSCCRRNRHMKDNYRRADDEQT